MYKLKNNILNNFKVDIDNEYVENNCGRQNATVWRRKSKITLSYKNEKRKVISKEDFKKASEFFKTTFSLEMLNKNNVLYFHDFNTEKINFHHTYGRILSVEFSYSILKKTRIVRRKIKILN